MPSKKAFTPPAPWAPARHSKWAVYAVQAVSKGVATPEQQKMALHWIIWQACQTYELAYRTDPHDHAFCTGRAFAGQQIVGAVNFDDASSLPEA